MITLSHWNDRSDQFFKWVAGHFWQSTLLFMLLALVTRMAFLGTGSIYLDEAASIFIGQQRLGLLLERVAHDTNPPLHFVLLKYWMELMGNTPEAVRLLSVLLSVLSIPLLMSLGQRLFNARVAVMATLLFVFSEIHIYYSHEARTYTLVSLLTLLSFHYFFRLFEEDGTWQSAIGMGLVSWLLIHAHYAVYVLFLGQFCCALLYFGKRRKAFWRYAAGQAGALLLFLPWAIYWQTHFERPDTWAEAPDGAYIYYVLHRFAGSEAGIFVYGGVLLVGFASALLWKGKALSMKWRRESVVALWGLGSLGLAVACSHVLVPAFQPNYVLYATCGVFLLLALCWERLPLPGFPRAALFGIGILILATTVKYNYKNPRRWEEAVATIKALDSPQTLKVVDLHYNRLPFMYYFDRNAFVNYRHFEQAARQLHIAAPATAARLKELAQGYDQVLLAIPKFRLQMQDHAVVAVLESEFRRVKEFRYSDLFVRVYVP